VIHEYPFKVEPVEVRSAKRIATAGPNRFAPLMTLDLAILKGCTERGRFNAARYVQEIAV
jgi:hypothetical protein